MSVMIAAALSKYRGSLAFGHQARGAGKNQAQDRGGRVPIAADVPRAISVFMSVAPWRSTFQAPSRTASRRKLDRRGQRELEPRVAQPRRQERRDGHRRKAEEKRNGQYGRDDQAAPDIGQVACW